MNGLIDILHCCRCISMLTSELYLWPGLSGRDDDIHTLCPFPWQPWWSVVSGLSPVLLAIIRLLYGGPHFSTNTRRHSQECETRGQTMLSTCWSPLSSVEIMSPAKTWYQENTAVYRRETNISISRSRYSTLSLQITLRPSLRYVIPCASVISLSVFPFLRLVHYPI